MLPGTAIGPAYSPPALAGLRGSQPGSYEAAHAVAREGRTFPIPKKQTESVYDLVDALTYCEKGRVKAQTRIYLAKMKPAQPIRAKTFNITADKLFLITRVRRTVIVWPAENWSNPIRSQLLG